MPDSTILMDYILHRLAGLIENLRVIPENMDRNLMGSMGLFFSQRVLLALVDAGMGRQDAYVLVQRCAMQSWDTRRLFRDIVFNDAEITERLSPSKLEEIFDPSYYLRHEDLIFSRVFG